MIVGYSLAHNQLFAPVFAESLGLIPIIRQAGYVNNSDEVIIGQKCLKVAFQKGGLMGMMDKILYTELYKQQFRYYFASISNANKSSLDFVTRSGYQKVHSTEARMYFLIDIKPYELTNDSYTTKWNDGRDIQFRFATNGDIAELDQMNKAWMKENLTDLSHGYLAATFPKENWEFMIERKWVVLAEL